MSRYIDAERLKNFFYSEASGTEDTIYDCVIEAGLEEFEDEAIGLCRKMIEMFRNVIDTEEEINIKNQWISVQSRMPNDREKVLTIDRSGNIHINMTDKEWNEMGMPFGIDENNPRFYMVTHWMSLPKPPQED